MELSLDGKRSTERSVVALGMFDGVHLGHQVLLRKARHIAAQEHAPLVCCTFTSHPMALIQANACPPMLTTLDERAALIEKQGADILCASAFNAELRDMPPEVFVGRLVQRWHPAAVVVGYNYTFGRKAEGTPALLAGLGQALGFRVEIVPEIRVDGQSVSSTRIRELLKLGKAGEVRQLLGRPYTRLAQCLGGGRLMLQPNGKQEPARGRYRTLLSDGARTIAGTVALDGDGRARTSAGDALPIRAEVTIGFLEEIS